MRIVTILVLASIPAQGVTYIDLTKDLYDIDEGEKYESFYDSNWASDDPAWYSWDLGTDGSLPETIIIVNPYK